MTNAEFLGYVEGQGHLLGSLDNKGQHLHNNANEGDMWLYHFPKYMYGQKVYGELYLPRYGKGRARYILAPQYQKAIRNIKELKEVQQPINYLSIMFENIQNSFNGMFGKIAPGMCRLTMNGNIAVKCANGYKSYNVDKGTLTNVTNFCFNVGDEMFFVIPTNKVEIGDIILVGGKPKCVTSVDKKIITVIDYENSEVRQVVPERHVFMGSTYFYGKIVSMFGNSFKKGKGLGNIMKMMMFSSIMGGGKSECNGGLGQMMAMSMFMGEKNNPFEGMFDFNLDTDEEVEEVEDTKEEGE